MQNKFPIILNIHINLQNLDSEAIKRILRIFLNYIREPNFQIIFTIHLLLKSSNTFYNKQQNDSNSLDKHRLLLLTDLNEFSFLFKMKFSVSSPRTKLLENYGIGVVGC